MSRRGTRCRTCKMVAIYRVDDAPEMATSSAGPWWIAMTIAKAEREHAATHPLPTGFEHFDPDADPKPEVTR